MHQSWKYEIYRLLVRFLIGVMIVSGLKLGNDSFAQDDQSDFKLRTFETRQLSDTYYSEGANFGDFDGDGINDVVYGPFWFQGPEFKTKHEIYKPVAQNVRGYADNFFSWVYDFNSDGNSDVLVVGFPGTPAYVYENPGKRRAGKHWNKHEVFDWVSNESPQMIDIVGDQRPELVCTRDGFFGYATIDWGDGFKKWVFHKCSKQVAPSKFGHGLGVGDINGDGRQDIIAKNGWYSQPESLEGDPEWEFNAVTFANAGGAEMYAYDVDGDGDNDVITSLAAHDYGLAWHQQFKEDGKIVFVERLIMGRRPDQNKYGVVFTELHSVNLVDMNDDGLKDIVTGKTYWSHHDRSPMWDSDAVVYWFELVRGKEDVDWVPHEIGKESGIGRQLTVGDLNKDGLPDIVVGGMKGAHVLIHETKVVSEKEWNAAEPKVFDGASFKPVKAAKAKRGEKLKLDAKTSMATGAIEGELLKFSVVGGAAEAQDMAGFKADQWSGTSHLWWTNGSPGDKLTIELPEFTGTVDLDLVMTCAVDYGIVQLSLDDQPLGEPIDLYETQVVTTGLISFPKISVRGRKHTLGVQILGMNPAGVEGYMFALDYLRINKSDGSFVKGRPASAGPELNEGEKPKSIEGTLLNLDFELGNLNDWKAAGNAFEGQPVKGDSVNARRTDMASNHDGEFWIGSFEKYGDGRTGTLTSSPFVVSQPWVSFLTNGGSHDETRVELIRKDNGKVVYQIKGTNSETMRRVVVDLRSHVGKEIMIRVVDEHRGGWGHINFDHFRLHAKAPAEVTPSQVVLTPDGYPYAGLDGQQAATAMKLPEGFSVTVGASEPDVKQPIAMTIDDQGRVWIVEAYEYPTRAKGDTGRDRILIFEDTDGNGTLDHRKVFYEGLNLVSGLEVGFGGVWVGAAPYLMFIPDKNGDDIPDAEPEILLDGWGYEDTHETLNAFTWGPDGWLYGCHGVFTHSKVGKPGTADAERTPLNCAVWRYHPTRHEFDVFAHGTSNPWGVDFNDHGQAFITACVIPHLYHIIQGARYQRQGGQHFNRHTYRDIVTIADHLHYIGATPHSGNKKSDSAGGGHAHAGAMIYLGDRWPEKYRNQIFMNNIHGQRLNVDILNPEGSGYVGSHGPDFLLTGDEASQILNLRYGPDGNAWMIDWYDMQACHHHENGLHDRTNGRIYKINFGDDSFSKPKTNLATASDQELAQMVLAKNDWYVRHGRRLLQERSQLRSIEASALASLRKIAMTHTDDTRRLRAMWALHVIGDLDLELTNKLLVDESPYVRGWAVQLVMESSNGNPSSELVEKLAKLAKSDASPIVRLYLASAAQLLPLESRWGLLASLANHSVDSNDHNLPLMYWYAAEPLADVDPARALAFAMSVGENIPLLREFMLRRIGSSGSETSLDVLVKGISKADSSSLKLTYLKAIRSALKGQRKVKPPASWQGVSKQLMNSSQPRVRLQAIALGLTFGDEGALNVMRSKITDAGTPVENRLVALQSLLDANDTGLVPTLTGLLKSESTLREAAIRGLAQFDDQNVARSLLATYPSFTSEQKRMALGTLCSRVASGNALLKAIESKQIAGTELTADLVRQLKFLKNKEIDELLESVWGTARESAADKLAMIAEFKALVESDEYPNPDAELGRAVFSQTCMKCHELYGVGYKIGPDLTGSNRSNLDYLLSNVVDPSAVMANEYRSTMLLTDDGRLVSGLVKSEDKNAITIQTSDALVTIPLGEIEDRNQSNKSMMPDDQLKQFSPHQVRSLIAYLRGNEQIPMLASQQNATALFNGTDLDGWSGTEGLWSVENGEIVGRTDGLTKNEWLVSDLSVSDFRLTLEIKLVNAAGNSGVQFRSKVYDGEVSGYQADIGKGWWGKLYEEHGRALLWSESGEEHVIEGDWNEYEIVAEEHHIQTFLNGKPCVNLDDPQGATRGIIAFQLHSGGKTEVRFRNLKLEILDGDSKSAQ